MKVCAGFAVLSIALAGCAETTSSSQVGLVTQNLSGKTGTSGDATVTWHADGTMTGPMPNGEEFYGVWEERNGQFCRTNIRPERLAATGCLDVEFEGDRATFTREDGSTITWVLQG